MTCSATNASGQYGCTVPSGWSGGVTPSLGGYSFTPASRSHSNVTTSQTAQNFTAAADPSSAAILYIQVDHLNTPRLVTNQQGQARWRWDQQEPFGINVPDENPSALGAFEFPLRFPGQYADKETNLNYNYFRDYDPTVGRYVESDPIGLEGGLNTYAYVGGDPLRSADPNGLWVVQVIGGVIGGTAGAIQAANAGGGWTTQNAGNILWGALTGTATGVVATFVPTAWGALGTSLAGGLIGGAGNAVNQYAATGNVCLGQVAVQAGVGALSGLAGASIGLTAARQYISRNRTWTGWTSPPTVKANISNALTAGGSASAATSGAAQVWTNLGVPSSLGGMAP